MSEHYGRRLGTRGKEHSDFNLRIQNFQVPKMI